MGAAAGAMFMFTVMNALGKHLSDTHSVIEIGFYRNLIGSLLFLAIAMTFGQREIFVVRSKPFVLVTRSIFGAVSLVATFAAFSLMPMAETAVLLFTASLFVPVLGVVFLNEHVGPWRWSAVVVGFLGVAIMVDPGGNMTTLGVTLALGAALLQAGMAVMLRHLGGYERPETISLYFFLIGLAVTALGMPFVAVPLVLSDLPLLLGLGFSGALAQWLLSIAFRHAAAAIVAVFNYTTLVWAALFGWLIWNDWPAPVVYVGATIVVAANVLIIWRESRLESVRNRNALRDHVALNQPGKG